MTSLQLRTEYLSLLYRALEAPIGVVLSTDDANRAVQALYKARALNMDPALAMLEIRRAPRAPTTELMIVKRGAGEGEGPRGTSSDPPSNVPTLRDLGLDD